MMKAQKGVHDGYVDQTVLCSILHPLSPDRVWLNAWWLTNTGSPLGELMAVLLKNFNFCCNFLPTEAAAITRGAIAQTWMALGNSAWSEIPYHIQGSDLVQLQPSRRIDICGLQVQALVVTWLATPNSLHGHKCFLVSFLDASVSSPQLHSHHPSPALWGITMQWPSHQASPQGMEGSNGWMIWLILAVNHDLRWWERRSVVYLYLSQDQKIYLSMSADSYKWTNDVS